MGRVSSSGKCFLTQLEECCYQQKMLNHCNTNRSKKSQDKVNQNRNQKQINQNKKKAYNINNAETLLDVLGLH